MMIILCIYIYIYMSIYAHDFAFCFKVQRPTLSPCPHLAKQGPGDRTKGGTQQQPAAGAPQAKDTTSHPMAGPSRHKSDWSLFFFDPKIGFKSGVFHEHFSYLLNDILYLLVIKRIVVEHGHLIKIHSIY